MNIWEFYKGLRTNIDKYCYCQTPVKLPKRRNSKNYKSVAEVQKVLRRLIMYNHQTINN